MRIDADGMDFPGVARRENAGHEHNGAAQPVAGVKMRVRNHAAQLRNFQEPVYDYDLRMKGIRERQGRTEIRTVRRVVLRRVSEFAQHCETRACASDGNAAVNGVVERQLHGSIAPAVDVVRLIPAGDKNGRSGAYRARDERIICSLAAGNDERGDGVYMAE